ncbi:MAG: ATP-binding protein [Bacteroidaceae bacterium]|nr:ATP-binding protein [Bacteroidaceae bacterium]
MEFKRNVYLQHLISGKGNGLVKIVTGIRRCGKSYLLFNLFRNHLLQSGVDEEHIFMMALDDWKNRKFRDPDVLMNEIERRLVRDGNRYYILLDEVQLLEHFVEVLLSLMHDEQCDVYVTGSNSRFLSSDVVTEFRGRGDEIRVFPLSFSEFYEGVQGDLRQAWLNYSTWGGLPQVALLEDEAKKRRYLSNLYASTYLHDIIERNGVKNDDGLRDVVRVLASSIGASANPKRIANTFASVEGKHITNKTIDSYIGYLEDAFLVSEALRYDVKGRKYIGTETKYFFTDIGLRNSILGFRQQEPTHIMENIIYNELLMRGYQVDVGLVELWNTDNQGKRSRVRLEIDFVLNCDTERIYVQSAYRLPSEEKWGQEQRSLLGISDNFRKVIIVGDDVKGWTNDQGIRIIGLWDFLLGVEGIE